ERGNALLEHALGRVHDARVDIAELLQAEQRRGMAGIIEYVGSGLVDRRDPRLGGRIRLCTCMDGERVETWRALRHVPLSFDLLEKSSRLIPHRQSFVKADCARHPAEAVISSSEPGDFRIAFPMRDPPPLNGSTLKYGFDHEGGPQ